LLDGNFALWQYFGMTLQEYLASQQIKPVAFATSLGVPPSTVSRWLRGIRRPGAGYLIKIERLTGGAVTLKDFASSDDDVSPLAAE
jgi:DNA-binding transcriptional regulator YdaS (Cro superfamily)